MSEIILAEIKMKELNIEITRLKAELAGARDALRLYGVEIANLTKRTTEILEKEHSPLNHDLIEDEKRCERCKFIKLAKKSLSELEAKWGPI